MATKKFTPADYMTDIEKEKLDLLKQKLDSAKTLQQLQSYEIEIKSLLKTAYYRKRAEEEGKRLPSAVVSGSRVYNPLRSMNRRSIRSRGTVKVEVEKKSADS